MLYDVKASNALPITLDIAVGIIPTTMEQSIAGRRSRTASLRQRKLNSNMKDALLFDRETAVEGVEVATLLARC